MQMYCFSVFISFQFAALFCLFVYVFVADLFSSQRREGREGNQVCPAEALLFVLELYVCVVHTESNPCD